MSARVSGRRASCHGRLAAPSIGSSRLESLYRGRASNVYTEQLGSIHIVIVVYLDCPQHSFLYHWLMTAQGARPLRQAGPSRSRLGPSGKPNAAFDTRPIHARCRCAASDASPLLSADGFPGPFWTAAVRAFRHFRRRAFCRFACSRPPTGWPALLGVAKARGRVWQPPVPPGSGPWAQRLSAACRASCAAAPAGGAAAAGSRRCEWEPPSRRLPHARSAIVFYAFAARLRAPSCTSHSHVWLQVS